MIDHHHPGGISINKPGMRADVMQLEAHSMP